MSATEILAQLPHLTAAELCAVQAKLDELIGETWHDDAHLTEADQAQLNAALAKYEADPNAGRTWNEVRVSIQAKLRP